MARGHPGTRGHPRPGEGQALGKGPREAPGWRRTAPCRGRSGDIAVRLREDAPRCAEHPGAKEHPWPGLCRGRAAHLPHGPPPSPPSSPCPVLTSPAGVPAARRAHGPAGARPGTARHGPPRAAPGRARRPRAVPRRRRQGERGEPRRGRPGVGETPPVPSCPPCRGSPEPRRGRLRALRAPRVPCATGGRPVPAPSQETCPVLGGASGLRRTPHILCRTLEAPWSGPIPPAHRVPVSPPWLLGPAGDTGHQPSASPWVQHGQDGSCGRNEEVKETKGLFRMERSLLSARLVAGDPRCQAGGFVVTPLSCCRWHHAEPGLHPEPCQGVCHPKAPPGSSPATSLSCPRLGISLPWWLSTEEGEEQKMTPHLGC